MASMWVTLISVIENLVLVSLLGLSVWSISIMIDRKRFFDISKPADLDQIKSLIMAGNWDKLTEWAKTSPSVEGSLILAAAESNRRSREELELVIKSHLSSQKLKVEKGFAVLATLGSNAPFIGLFGTVLGIIRSFAALGGGGDTTSVMSGISLALVATAAGLFVAIPAVVAFNIFNKKLRDIFINCEALKDYYLSFRT